MTTTTQTAADFDTEHGKMECLRCGRDIAPELSRLLREDATNNGRRHDILIEFHQRGECLR
jgi:hypothetical protein